MRHRPLPSHNGEGAVEMDYPEIHGSIVGLLTSKQEAA
jgi:hypothetical protein